MAKIKSTYQHTLYREYPNDIKYVKKFETLMELKFDRMLAKSRFVQALRTKNERNDTPAQLHDGRTARLCRLWEKYVGGEDEDV